MLKTTCCIYKITNEIDGKFYIGFTTDYEKRLRAHSKSPGNCPKFHAAIKKHGWNNFKPEIIYESWDSDWCLKEIEPIFIKQLQPEYNLTKGGDGVLGLVHSEKTRKIMSEKKLGIKRGPHSGECKRKLRESNLGQKRSPESCENNRQAQLKRNHKHSEETKEKMSNSHQGFKHSNESLNKMSVLNSGENNPNWGTFWINKNNIRKMIPKNSLQEWLDKGWIKGKLIKTL